MTTFTVPNVAARAMADAYDDVINTGSGTAQILIYDATGGVPAVEDAISTQVLLAEVDIGDPAFGAATDGAPGGLLTLNGVPLSDLAINATGTAAFFRITDKDGNVRGQGDAGTSGTTLILNSAALQVGATFTIISLTVNHPE